MNQNDPRITEYQNDLQRYQSWGNLFLGFSFGSFFSPNVPCDSLTLHNGLEYLKAKMKLNALNSQHHSDEEIEHRLRQIDEDLRNAVPIRIRQGQGAHLCVKLKLSLPCNNRKLSSLTVKQNEISNIKRTEWK